MITRQRGLNRAGWYLDKNTSKSKIIRIQGDKKQYMLFQEQSNKLVLLKVLTRMVEQ